MTTTPILRQLPLFPDLDAVPKKPENKPNLHTFWLHQEMLPVSITSSPPAMRTLDLLGALHWGDLPERNLERDWGQPTISNAALIIAELVKLNEGLDSFGTLYRYLQEHTAFISLCGFPAISPSKTGFSFNTRVFLPTQRHLTSMLRHIPNTCLQFLLADSIQLIGAELAAGGITWGDCISLDTKHIIA